MVFDGSDLTPAADLVRRFASEPDQITRWIDIRPLDVPDDLLPVTKGLLGRKKKAEPPSFQLIYVDTGEGEHTINLEARGCTPLDVATTSGVSVPSGWKVEGNRHAFVGYIPTSATAEELLGFGIAVLHAVLAGWGGRLEATGIDGTRYHGVGYPRV